MRSYTHAATGRSDTPNFHGDSDTTFIITPVLKQAPCQHFLEPIDGSPTKWCGIHKICRLNSPTAADFDHTAASIFEKTAFSIGTQIAQRGGMSHEVKIPTPQ